MGLFSFVGGLFGGGSQKKASQQATDAIVGALNRGIDTQNAFQSQVRQDYMPYTQAGTAAIGDLSQLVTGYDGNSAGLAARIQADPLYQSVYRNGEEALLQNAAATGGVRGGNTQRGLADFGADTLAGVYQQILGNLGNVANLGLGAQGAVTQTGQNTANSVTSLLGNIGQSQANNYLAKGRINAQNWQNAGSFLDSIGSNFLPGGSGLQGALKAIF